MLIEEALSEEVIGAAIEVHRILGPGLLESVYEECLCHELRLRSLAFERQLALPVCYKGIVLECGYRVDLLVEERLVVELKSIDKVMPIHRAQILTYMRLLSSPVGLILNFNAPLLKEGVHRLVL